MRLARPAVVLSVTVAGALVASSLAALPSTAAPAVGTGSTIPQDVIDASAAPGHSWSPEAASYGVGKTTNLPVTMKDGTVLRADVYYPTDANGKRAKGPFPVVLTLTPYGKNLLGASSGTGDQTGPSNYLVQRGFIDVVADVRGTGDSEG
jgi:predicted acyl esterase